MLKNVKLYLSSKNGFKSSLGIRSHGYFSLFLKFRSSGVIKNG